MPAADTIRRLIHAPSVRQVPLRAAQAVLGLRLCVLLRKCDRNPLPELEQRFGSILAARRFGVVVEAIGQIWPEPFAVSPPCCPMMSFDEALLADMANSAASEDRAGFDRMTAEMMGSDARDTLFAALTAFERVRGMRAG